MSDQQAHYTKAAEMKGQGFTDDQIVDTLTSQGLDEEGAKKVVSNLNDAIRERGTSHSHSHAQSDGGGFPGWLIWIIILIGFNVLSYMFDWGWIIY